MGLLSPLKELVDSGDPTVRVWPLVNSYWQPFALSFAYVFFVKRLGPAYMENRKPFDLRKLMIVYNFCVVCVYAASISVLSYNFLTTTAYKSMCSESEVTRNHYTYYCASAGWFLYLVKYIEFTDTIFFVLRKKSQLITNLHVIHHAMLPILCWLMLRTEKTGFQFIPGFINSCIHIIMYTYYGLAAMGPEVQKKLWWKMYLTRLQMAQFVVILLFMFVVLPLSGCKTTKHGVFLTSLAAAVFLGLFYNFYKKTYNRHTHGKASNCVNGVHHSNGVCLRKKE